mmetsp:Transcript_27766/g.88264  ORF Transcript_27766/g.88264 Transcript_27766/m.88264 type:complete len:366 (+) Transcript_27766:1172-2269(+)
MQRPVVPPLRKRHASLELVHKRTHPDRSSAAGRVARRRPLVARRAATGRALLTLRRLCEDGADRGGEDGRGVRRCGVRCGVHGEVGAFAPVPLSLGFACALAGSDGAADERLALLRVGAARRPTRLSEAARLPPEARRAILEEGSVREEEEQEGGDDQDHAHVAVKGAVEVGRRRREEGRRRGRHRWGGRGRGRARRRRRRSGRLRRSHSDGAVAGRVNSDPRQRQLASEGGNAEQQIGDRASSLRAGQPSSDHRTDAAGHPRRLASLAAPLLAPRGVRPRPAAAEAALAVGRLAAAGKGGQLQRPARESDDHDRPSLAQSLGQQRRDARAVQLREGDRRDGRIPLALGIRRLGDDCDRGGEGAL